MVIIRWIRGVFLVHVGLFSVGFIGLLAFIFLRLLLVPERFFLGSDSFGFLFGILLGLHFNHPGFSVGFSGVLRGGLPGALFGFLLGLMFGGLGISRGILIGL